MGNNGSRSNYNDSNDYISMSVVPSTLVLPPLLLLLLVPTATIATSIAIATGSECFTTRTAFYF